MNSQIISKLCNNNDNNNNNNNNNNNGYDVKVIKIIMDNTTNNINGRIFIC